MTAVIFCSSATRGDERCRAVAYRDTLLVSCRPMPRALGACWYERGTGGAFWYERGTASSFTRGHERCRAVAYRGASLIRKRTPHRNVIGP